MLQAVISDQKALKYEPSAIKRQHVALMEDDSVVEISGIRRCGKSTLLQAKAVYYHHTSHTGLLVSSR